MQAISSVPSGAKKQLDFTYDYQGRRTQKISSTWNGSAYVAQSTNKFVYDGWNLVAELNGNNGIIRTYIWGLDLSGQAPLSGGAGGGLQGAGGVGGLLAIKPTAANTLFAAYDGNGNVTGLIDATTGTMGCNFEYGPFGETIRLASNASNQSPFRYSTKYTDDETDLVYYGYRYCNPSTGRWLSRDPLGEEAFFSDYIARHFNSVDKLYKEKLRSLYLFAGNDGANHFDRTGLDADVTWNPSPSSCPVGTYVTFAQVGYGGAKCPANYNDPFVDDGTKGLFGKPTGCLEYPNNGFPGNFEDSPGPGAAVGGVNFITCQLCIEDCKCRIDGKGHRTDFFPGRKIVQVGPCKKWYFGYKGLLNQAPDATPAEMKIWEDAIRKYDRKWQECYRCNSGQQSH